LNRLLRGDLDWIVIKTLEKDRNRRYETAQELVNDVQRCLRDDPMEAGPPSLGNRVRKTIRRHRVAFGYAGLFAFAAATHFGLLLRIGPGNYKQNHTPLSVLPPAVVRLPAAEVLQIAYSDARLPPRASLRALSYSSKFSLSGEGNQREPQRPDCTERSFP
jgi:hypothetical protein